ncbi:MAG: CAP domain-containing protein [Chitinophagaceae bacterium]|nr:MAG: CAP domain-containing protein [Chitinophagaceae bacterium]
MKHGLVVACALAVSLPGWGQSLTPGESDLYRLVQAYRDSLGLPRIPLSPSLVTVAQAHARDLAQHRPDGGACNTHSWSASGPWTACCYTPDHAQAACMWNKPRELTRYRGNGYEIACASSGAISAAGALQSWLGSAGHRSVIANEDAWKDMHWGAIGVGMSGGYAVVWFGVEPDE